MDKEPKYCIQLYAPPPHEGTNNVSSGMYLIIWDDSLYSANVLEIRVIIYLGIELCKEILT